MTNPVVHVQCRTFFVAILSQFKNFEVGKNEITKENVDTVARFPIFIQDTCGTLTFRLRLVWEGETQLFTASVVFTTWTGHCNGGQK